MDLKFVKTGLNWSHVHHVYYDLFTQVFNALCCVFSVAPTFPLSFKLLCIIWIFFWISKINFLLRFFFLYFQIAWTDGFQIYFYPPKTGGWKSICTLYTPPHSLPKRFWLAKMNKITWVWLYHWCVGIFNLVHSYSIATLWQKCH